MRRIAATVLLGLLAAGCGSQHVPITARVTERSTGQTVRLRVGDGLAVRLGPVGPMSWDPPTVTGAALVLVASTGGYPTGKTLNAVYRAVASGVAELHSQTDLGCLHTTPRCLPPQAGWSVRVVVSRS